MVSAFPLFIVLKDVLVKTSPSDVLEVANQMLTTTLIKNFANMDHATKRNSVSVNHPNIPTNEHSLIIYFQNYISLFLYVNAQVNVV